MLADYRQDEQIKYYSDYKNSHVGVFFKNFLKVILKEKF